MLTVVDDAPMILPRELSGDSSHSQTLIECQQNEQVY